jgi:2-(1,2-epoxy-1,2-dihydrophenyl)acetyl-CoA isomerase
MSDYETLAPQVDAQVAVLTLQRPARLNSFTEQMHAELRAAFDAIEGALRGR